MDYKSSFDSSVKLNINNLEEYNAYWHMLYIDINYMYRIQNCILNRDHLIHNNSNYIGI